MCPSALSTMAMAVLATVVALSAPIAHALWLPGVQTMGVGFDMVTAKPKTNLLAAWGGGNTTWTLNGTVWDVPPGVLVEALDEHFLASGVSVFTDVSSYRSHLAQQSTSSSWGGLFSRSSSVNIYENEFYNQTSILSQAEDTMSLYKVGLPPFGGQTLSPSLAAALAAMPVQYNASTARLWAQFVATYGTHYAQTAVMGGRASMHAFVKSCLFESETNEWVVEMTSRSFGAFTDYHASISHYGSVDKSFTEFSTVSFALEGGDTTTNTSTTDGWSTWKSTIYTAPVSLLTTYEPLWLLLDAPASAGDPAAVAQQAAVKAAVLAYLDAAAVAAANRGCTSPTAWNYNASAQADDGSCIESPVIAQRVPFSTTTFVKAGACPNYLEIAGDLPGVRNDGMGDFMLYVRYKQEGLCSTYVDGGSPANSLSNPAAMEMVSTKSGGSGYGWWYGGTSSRSFFLQDTSRGYEVVGVITNIGYSVGTPTYSIICH